MKCFHGWICMQVVAGSNETKIVIYRFKKLMSDRNNRVGNYRGSKMNNKSICFVFSNLYILTDTS